MRSSFRIVPVGALAMLISVAAPGLVFAQVDAGPLATWNDRELTVSYSPSTNETIGTLAIVPPGPGGAGSSVILVFEARWRGRESSGVPAVLELRCYPRPLADQRVVRRVDLRFNVDTGTDRAPLYFYGSSWGTYGFGVLAPGVDIPVVRFTMRPVELHALAAGEVITGEAIGFPFVIDAAQIDAIRAFARVVHVRDIRLP